MICAKCGANNPSESAYCGGCGSLLGPAPETAAEGDAPKQESPIIPPSEPIAQPDAASMSGDMPTYNSIQPVPAQDSPAFAVEETPTVRPVSAQLAPAASEFANIVPAAPTPGFPQASGPLPAPGFPGAAYPQQGQMPGYPGGMYPQQGQMPGYPGGMYPQQGQAPGFPSGVLYPQQGQVPGFSSGMYPPNTPQPTPGGYPPQTPMPGYPSGVYPQQGQPSGVFPPTMNEFPAGVYPTPFSGQPSQVGWGAYAPGTVPGPQPSTPSKLINPLPLWGFIASIVVGVALLAILTFFTGADWAAGAQTAGIVALVLGVLVLIAFGVRAGLGMLVQTNPHRRAQIISSLLVILLLIAFGAIGLTQQTGIHSAQAHALESQHNWQAAINEYRDGGQTAPASEDIARTYNGWGEQLVSEGQYAVGIAKFESVTSTYYQASTGFARAKSDAISAYLNWGQQASQNQRFDQATQHYDKLLTQSYCDSACQTQISAADATAYYKLAEQKLSQQPPDYASAVAAFNQLTTRFSSSSSSQSAHADYAKALWGDGQQLLTTTCSSALTIYQQLSSQFSDTTQGQQATTALTQPVTVKGHFTSNIPTGADAPGVGLAQGISAGMTSDQFYAILAKSPLAAVKSDGTFTFTSVKQGSYYLVWGTINQSAGKEIFSVSQRYPATAGPLCGFDFGDINETFPLA